MSSIINPAPGQRPPKWRGIHTTSIPKHEDKAITIINRLGQKSFSLPRIDDEKRWAGFPGLAGTAKEIAKIVPSCEFYVEPFAGASRVFQEVLRRKDVYIRYFILNEKSTFINQWLKKEFTGWLWEGATLADVKITKQDFAKCIKKYDSEKTFFLIDPPWVKSYYDQSFACFDRKSIIEYEEEILELCKNIKGKFIITTRTERIRMQKAKFRHKTITSIYKVSGKLPKVLLTANFDLRKKK